MHPSLGGQVDPRLDSDWPQRRVSTSPLTAHRAWTLCLLVSFLGIPVIPVIIVPHTIQTPSMETRRTPQGGLVGHDAWGLGAVHVVSRYLQGAESIFGLALPCEITSD